MITRRKILKTFLATGIVLFIIALKLLWDLRVSARVFPSSSDSSLRPPDHRSSDSRTNFLRIVHLDLKGAPPKMSYLMSLLPLLKSAGCNGVLIEYEDMFPFSGKLTNISSRVAYSFDEIRSFIASCKNYGMEVIPLVQTFGHLEYVLKLEEFKHLRELEKYPNDICPSKVEAIHVVKEMIRQILEVHTTVKYLHIGCDEVQHLGKCPQCSRRTPKWLFSHHVYRIASFIRATYPHVTPLFWDDMMRQWNIYDLQDSGLANIAEPVVWSYGHTATGLVPHYVWLSYFKLFPRIWVASAFKGATTATATVPDLTKHFDNNLSWMKFIKNKKERVDAPVEIFGGIFLTGWSRYDHFAVLCELLPAGIPSLVLNLILTEEYSKRLNHSAPVSVASSFRKWVDVLRCPRTVIVGDYAATGNAQYLAGLGTCDFPGSSVYRLNYDYLALKERLDSAVGAVETSAWSSDYNVRKAFTNPSRLSVAISELEDLVRKGIGMFKSSAAELLAECYEDFVVQEWIQQRIEPYERKVKDLYQILNNLMKVDTWPRRPLP